MAKKSAQIIVRLEPELKEHVQKEITGYGQLSDEVREFLIKRTKFKPKKL